MVVRRLIVRAGVAPLDEFANGPQVVAAAVPADAQDEGLDAGVDQVVGRGGPETVVRPPRALDLARVAPGSLAVLRQDVVLLVERLDVAERVPQVAVLGDELERDLRATAADQDRQLADGRRVELAEALLDPRQRGAQLA